MSDTAVQYEVLSKLTKDLKEASRDLTGREARYLVDAFYTMQGYRISYSNQVNQMAKSDEPNALLAFFGGQTEALENQIQKALGKYAEGSPLGQWAMLIMGIGPVITAGLLAHIDFSRAKTAGDVWRFAGLDPTQTWNKGEIRPWNASLKLLAYKAGESFVKQQSREDDVYGKVFAARKADEWKQNLSGGYAEQAVASLAKKNYAKNTNAYQWYAGNIDPQWASYQLVEGFPQTFPKTAFLPEGAPRSPMLSPAHIHSRARRVAVKLFLSHFFEVGYYLTHGARPPAPYAMTFAGHAHYITPPNAPWV